MNPGWVLGGEMWAEMSTNYYQAALSDNLFVKLFSTDYGYVPLPQRLIAAVFNFLKIPVYALPFLYTWSSILLTAFMVGVFCLYFFREIVESDFSRFIFSLLMLLIVDFETKTFINFTYYGAFFIAIISALLIVSQKNTQLNLLWFVPVLCISKPAVLAALPGFLLGSYSKNKNILFVLFFAVVLGCVQVVSLIINFSNNGTSLPIVDGDLFAKTFLSIKYFAFFIGRYSIGNLVNLGELYSILIGSIIFIISLYFCYRKNNNYYSLIIVGFLLIYFNLLLNVVTLPNVWNENFSHLTSLPVYRHNIVSIFGLYLFIFGFFLSIVFFLNKIIESSYLSAYATLLFLTWVIAAGWLSKSIQMNRQPNFPVLNSSYWQDLSPILENKNINSPICIPINPLGWIYSRGCFLLNPEINWLTGYYFNMTSLFSNLNKLVIKPPVNLSSKSLVSFAIVIRPFNYSKANITANAHIYLKGSKEIKIFSGSGNIKLDGGLLLMTGQESISLSSIEKIEISFSSPVQVGYYEVFGATDIGILWMGY